MENIQRPAKNYVWEILYKITLWITGILIWLQIGLSIKAEYDDNIAYAINALLLSLFMALSILVLLIMKSKVLKMTKKSTLIFILLCSPVSLILFFYIFILLMGAYYKT